MVEMINGLCVIFFDIICDLYVYVLLNRKCNNKLCRIIYLGVV